MNDKHQGNWPFRTHNGKLLPPAPKKKFNPNDWPDALV